MLDTSELKDLINAVYAHFDVVEQPEITLECNPDDLREGIAEEYVAMGINRLSIGIQSFRDEDLKRMNRAHSAAEAVASVHRAQQAGIDNLTIDLIYALPELSMDAWIRNIDQALELNVPHLSCYCLTIEEHTAFAKWKSAGKLRLPPDDLAASQYLTLIDRLESAGIHLYEVSNFARKGYESKHNSAYWSGTHYLGIGPSAHSFDGQSRQWNVANNVRYAAQLTDGTPWFEREELSAFDRYNEYLLTGLRTTAGIDLETARALCREASHTALPFDPKELVEHGEAEIHEGRLNLTRKGLLRADAIASEFFIIES